MFAGGKLLLRDSKKWKALGGLATLTSLGGLAYYNADDHSLNEANTFKSYPSNTKTVSKFKTPHQCSIENRYVAGCSELKVFSGNANPELAEAIAKELGVELGKSTVKRFADMEVSVKIDESVRGKDVYVIQPTSPSVNEHVMELLLMTSALRHASAKRVTLVVPYFGYMRSLSSSVASKNKKDWNYFRSNLAATDIATMMEVSGAQRIIAVDMYPAGQGYAEGFFDRPVEHLRASDMIVGPLVDILNLKEKLKDKELVVASPHAACLTKAKRFKYELGKVLGDDANIGLATIIRTPPAKGMEEQGDRFDLVGNVKGKVVLVIEDLIDTGSTTLNAVETLDKAGAEEIYAYASHAILSKDAPQKLEASKLSALVTLDTVPIPQTKRDLMPTKLKQLSVAPMIADLISHMHYEEK